MTIIRPSTAADLHAIAAVILPIQQQEFGIPITLEAQPDLSDIQGFYQQGAGNFWVAEVDGQVVGTIGLLDIGGANGALRKMFVSAPFRGKQHAIAQRLLTGLLDWARTQGLQRIYLGTTDKFLAAHRFYEKNGFEEVAKGMLPDAFPVMAVDTKFYRLMLEPAAA